MLQLYAVIQAFKPFNILHIQSKIMMKLFTPLQQKLLTILSDGEYHSGQHLGDLFNVSRTAIWKNIEQFESIGVHIERTSKQGYRLSKPFIPLSAAAIKAALDTQTAQALDIHLFARIDSTNRFLKTQALTNRLTCCLAETQTAGRGRFRRHWHSPFGENIYCSLGVSLADDPSQLSGLSLVVSLAMHAVLQKHSKHPIRIKWPNDLIWQNRKLAGTLIEITAEGNGNTEVIIGMGLNINSISSTSQTTIDRPWCTLRDITQQTFNRNELIADLIQTLDCYLKRFKQKGFTDFQATWNTLDCLYHQQVTVSQPTGSTTGIGCGVNSAGYLLLKDDKKKIHTFSSGDTTLAQSKL
jgi:BirA family transcriptional regulator, biotin operon repressor / biotin---[acetyl-CoA-carboxylase] ligase